MECPKADQDSDKADGVRQAAVAKPTQGVGREVEIRQGRQRRQMPLRAPRVYSRTNRS